jgi:hypothetical protein
MSQRGALLFRHGYFTPQKLPVVHGRRGDSSFRATLAHGEKEKLEIEEECALSTYRREVELLLQLRALRP